MRKCRHAGLRLVVQDGGVDTELGAYRRAGGVVALGEDAAAGRVLTLAAPHGNEAAVGQRSHVGLGLAAGGEGVDGELGAHRCAGGGEQAAVISVAGAIVDVVRPDGDKAATSQAVEAWLGLHVEGTQAFGVGARLATLRDTGSVITLEHHVTVFGVGGVGVAVVMPADDKAAGGQPCHRGLVLVARGVGVGAEFRALRHAGVVVALGEHTRAAAVLAVRTPGHHVAAAGKRGHRRLVLVVGRVGVDLELGADGHALGIEALGEDTITPAVLVCFALPHGDVAAVRQPRVDGRCLRGRLVAVDAGAVEKRLGAVKVGRDVDGHRARHAGAAVTVGDADADAARGRGVTEGVGVGEALYHALNRQHAGVGIEGDGQFGAVHPAGRDGANGHATVAHGAAGHAHLARTRALVAHAELVLCAQAGKAQLVLQRVAAGVVHLQHAAVEVGAVGVDQAHLRVNQLRRRVDGVLGKGDAGRHIAEHRVGLPRVGDRVAEELLVDVVGGAFGVVVVEEADDEGAVRQAHHTAALGVGVVVERVDALLAIEPRAAGVELLDELGVAAVVANDEAAVAQRRHRRPPLVTAGLGVDAELGADKAAVGRVALAEHAVAAAVLPAGRPHDHEATTTERGDGGLVLVVGRLRVDKEARAEQAAGRVEALTVNP